MAFDVLGQVEGVEAEFGLDHQGHHVPGACQVNGGAGAVRAHDGGVGGTSAHVEDRDGGGCPGGGERATDGHVGLHAADLDGHADLGGQFGGDPFHLEAVGPDHHGDADGGLHGEFVGDAARHLLRHPGVDGE